MAGDAVAKKGHAEDTAEGAAAEDPAGALLKQLDACFGYRYPYRVDIGLHTKMTVSELKKLGQEVDDFTGLIQASSAKYLDGADIREKAASRGTAYHRVLELLDFADTKNCADVEKQITVMADQHRIGVEAVGMVRPYPIWRFAASALGARVRRAQERGQLHRAQQFVLGIPAREMGLVQGIIDAYLEEEDGLVLLDYKTDRVAEGQGEMLAKRYRVQLDYYQRALEQMTKKNVKERYIYSLSLMEVISV